MLWAMHRPVNAATRQHTVPAELGVADCRRTRLLRPNRFVRKQCPGC